MKNIPIDNLNLVREVWRLDMKNTGKRSFPRWSYAILAIGGLLAAGIFIGIMSVEGLTWIRLFQAAGFGVFGLLMFLGALSSS
jgi:hypothetical protein